ncbi:MAG TPA: PrsW family glutamic-type intramembrane protease [Polyangium sp.]|nr:PrsW family glutamic-type intramembrane protease [Polyangium sp.]
MLVVKILVELLVVLAPLALLAFILSRGSLVPSSPRSVVLTFLLGVVGFVPAFFFERAAVNNLGVRKEDLGTNFAAALVYAFLVAAPFEEGLKVAAAGPVWRWRSGRHRPIDGITYASASALGFVTAHNVVLLYERPFSWLDPLRAFLMALATPCIAATWGFALGRAHKEPMGGWWFRGAWLFASLGAATCHQLLFAHGPTEMLAMIPVFIVAGAITFFGGRDLLHREIAKPVAPRKSRISLPAPSIRSLREALRKSERPISFLWIIAGALVMVGVAIGALVGAVLLGGKMGVDFGAVDRDASRAAALAPILLLAAAAVVAFPFAGWLTARASLAQSVLEPAISALLAIGGGVVLLALAAPVAVVIGIACAPVAFGLACAGAWFGLDKPA